MIVYIIRSEIIKDRYYVGLTSNIGTRLEEHNTGQVRWTMPYRPWQLEVFFSFRDDTKAREFERYLKTGSGRAFCKRHF